MKKTPIKIFILLIVLLSCAFFIFPFPKKNKHDNFNIRNYQYVCVLPPYAKRFEYPYIEKNFDEKIKYKLNNYLNSLNKERNSERKISLIFSKNNWSSFVIIDDVLPSEFDNILSKTYNESYNGTCFKLAK